MQAETEAAELDTVIAAESGTAQAALPSTAPRGPTFTSPMGGSFSSRTNAAGGEIYTSKGDVNQEDVAGVVSYSYRANPNINLITGVHGSPNGQVVEDPNMFASDLARFGNLPGVRVLHLPSMTDEDVYRLLNGPDTTIGGFCNSEACLASFWAN